MKVEGEAATATVLHKVKVKEETEKECCGYQQQQQHTPPSSTSTATTATTAVVSAATAITTTVTNSNGVAAAAAGTSPSTTTAAVAPAATTVPALQQSSGIICHPPTSISAAATAVAAGNTVDPFPIDLDVKAKNKALSAPRDKPPREEVAQPEAHSPSSQQHQRIGATPLTTDRQKQTNGSRTEYKGASGCSRSSDNDSPLPPQSLKPELEEEVPRATSRTDETTDGGGGLANGTGGASRCVVSGIFAGHGKLKRLLGTLVQFATDISTDTGDTVRALVLALLCQQHS